MKPTRKSRRRRNEHPEMRGDSSSAFLISSAFLGERPRMSHYEKEQEQLLALWEEEEYDDGDFVDSSDDEEVDHLSVQSYHSDSECEETVTEDTDDQSIPSSFYLCKDSTKWKNHHANDKDKYEKAGDDWLSSFLSRHNQISLRTPEATSVARAKGFNRREVGRFYENLEDLTAKHDINASRLYNMDETGISTTINKPPKVLSTKGKKQVGIIASAERGQLTTVIDCCNAAGSFLPPFLIFSRKKMQPRLLDGAPPGTQGTFTPNGWTSGDVFLDWMRFFVEHVRPTPEKKILLLLDYHESHKYYPALDYASKNNIVILSLAPHTTHKMQPMDVAVYGPLKTYFEREVNAFQKSHPGRIINQYDVARLLSPAFLKCAVAINAVHGFERPGIWPVNKYAFGDEDYEPAAVIAGTSDMNIGTESTNSPERIDIPGSFAETSSTPLPSFLQKCIPPNPVDPLVEIIPSLNRATPFEFEALVGSITDSFKTPEKISSEVGCTLQPEPICSQIVSAVEPHVATNAQTIDTEIEENT
nr:uncharacterized protein LOC111502004 [Leptinotarsa decemlineata]